MRIVVSSAKGGTAKSMVAARLAFSLSREMQVTLLDCDAEEPVLHHFFPAECERDVVFSFLPEVDTEKCTRCGTCTTFCRFGALVLLGDRVFLQPELCHACGGCILLCPSGAIRERPHPIGELEVRRPFSTLTQVTTRLHADPSLAPRLLGVVAERAPLSGVQILDTPTGFPAGTIWALKGSDFCIAVAEATIFGLQSLEISARLARELGVPAGTVIVGDGEMKRELGRLSGSLGIPVLLELPYESCTATHVAQEGTGTAETPGFVMEFIGLYRSIAEKAGERA